MSSMHGKISFMDGKIPSLDETRLKKPFSPKSAGQKEIEGIRGIKRIKVT